MPCKIEKNVSNKSCLEDISAYSKNVFKNGGHLIIPEVDTKFVI